MCSWTPCADWLRLHPTDAPQGLPSGTVPELPFDPIAKSPPLLFFQLTFAMIDQPLCLLGCPPCPKQACGQFAKWTSASDRGIAW